MSNDQPTSPDQPHDVEAAPVEPPAGEAPGSAVTPPTPENPATPAPPVPPAPHAASPVPPAPPVPPAYGAQPAPAPYGAPPASAPAAAPTARPLPAWLDPHTLGKAAVAGPIAVGAALVAAVVILLLTWLLGTVTGAGSSSLPSGADFGGNPIIAIIVWLATLGLGGRLSAGMAASGGVASGSMSVTAGFVPIVVTIVALGAAAWWSFRQERTQPSGSRSALWAAAGAAGIAAGVLALVLAVVGRTEVRAGAVSFGGTLEVWTMSAMSFFGPLVFVGLATVFGRWLARGGVPSQGFFRALVTAPNRFRAGTRDLYDYLVVVAVVFVPASLVATFFMGDGAPAVWPAGVGALSVYAAALGHLGGVSAGGSLPGNSSGTEALTLFGGVSPWAWVLFLLAILAAVVAAIVIASRRAARPVPIERAWVLPVLVLAGTLFMGAIFGTLLAVGSASAMGMNLGFTVAITPTWWTYALALLWGAAVEALARFVAPTMLASLPALSRLKTAPGTIIGVPGAAPAVAYAAPPVPGAPYAAPPVPGAPVAPPVSDGAAPAAYAAPPAPGTETAAPAPIPPKPLSPEAKRRWKIGGIVVGALAIVGIAGAVTVSILQSTVFSPKGMVESYVNDIADGRFATAFAAGPGADSGNTALVKSDDVKLASAITDITVGDAESAGGVTTLPVTFEVDGERQTSYIEVSSAGKEFLFFDKWKISKGLETQAFLSVYGADEITVGGTPVTLQTSGTDLIAYPGVFELTAGDSKWYTLDKDSLNVTATGGRVAAQVVATPALAKEVQSQVDAKIDECVKSTDQEPEGCPFSLYSWREARNIVWSVVDYPVVDLRDTTGFAYDEPGKVKATYEAESFDGEWEAEDDEVNVYAYGDVEISGDDVTITFN